MKLWANIFELILLLLPLDCYYGSNIKDNADEGKDLEDEWSRHAEEIISAHQTRQIGYFATNCVQCGLFGLKENGYCILFDTEFKKFTAYCDFTSEPGYAWTLVTSFSRHIARTEINEVFKSKSLGQDFPVNQNTPNWYAFRLGKGRMKSIKMGSTHLRLTCSEYGPFKQLYTYQDYLRVNFSSLDPFSFESKKKCIPTEFARIKFLSCNNCKISLSQLHDRWPLHSSAGATETCGLRALTRYFAHKVKLFGFYDEYSPKFTCTKHPWSTTQIWFGSILLPRSPSSTA